MYQSILVPLDGSELAGEALLYAGEFAARLGASVSLLHVYNAGESDSSTRQAYIDQEVKRLEIECRAFQDKLAISPETRNKVRITGAVRTGNPAEEILRFAEETGISLILMATHGRSGIGRWAIGSVADKVLRASKVPVLLIRAGVPVQDVFDAQERFILVPLDGSELAESVLPHVQALAAGNGPEKVIIVLLGVCEPAPLPAYYPLEIPYNWEDHTATSKQASLEYLRKIAGRLAGAGFDARVEVVVGSPAEEIVRLANKRPYSLIVMATHGRSGIGRWVFGSVAARVLQGASAPLFLIRPEK